MFASAKMQSIKGPAQDLGDASFCRLAAY